LGVFQPQQNSPRPILAASGSRCGTPGRDSTGGKTHEVVAREIVEDLTPALAEFEAVASALESVGTTEDSD
jgi:hypothetical protein